MRPIKQETGHVCGELHLMVARMLGHHVRGDGLGGEQDEHGPDALALQFEEVAGHLGQQRALGHGFDLLLDAAVENLDLPLHQPQRGFHRVLFLLLLLHALVRPLRCQCARQSATQQVAHSGGGGALEVERLSAVPGEESLQS